MAGGTRLATTGAELLPGMVLLFAAPAEGAGAGAVLLLLELPWTALASAADRPGGPGAGARAEGGMGYGDDTGMPMSARSGWALDPLADPFPLSCGVITATICAHAACQSQGCPLLRGRARARYTVKSMTCTDMLKAYTYEAIAHECYTVHLQAGPLRIG